MSKLPFLLFACVILVLAQLANAMEIRVASQDSAPKYMLSSDGEMSGICIDIMHAIEADNPSIRFTGAKNILPFKRIESYLQSGRIDAFFGFLKTEQREALYTILPTPIFPVRYVMAVRREDTLQAATMNDIRQLGNGGVVMTIFGTANVDFLNGQSGILVDENAATVSQLLNKLISGRGRFAYYYDIGLIHTIKELGLANKVRILPSVINETWQYVVFSKEADPEKVEAVRKALSKLKGNGTLDAIYRKYAVL